MTVPARRRPEGASKIRLVAAVEDVRMSPIEGSVAEADEATVPELAAAPAAAPTPPVEPAVVAEPVVAPAPEEAPAATVAEEAPVAAVVEIAPAHQVPAEVAPEVQPVSTPQTAAPAPIPEPAESDEKKAVTFVLRTGLKKRAETAVLRTAGYEGGYTSMASLVEGALERELARLAEEFNNGESFPQNNGRFRQGRPLGS